MNAVLNANLKKEDSQLTEINLLPLDEQKQQCCVIRTLQCTYNATLRRVPETTVAVRKQ